MADHEQALATIRPIYEKWRRDDVGDIVPAWDDLPSWAVGALVLAYVTGRNSKAVK